MSLFGKNSWVVRVIIYIIKNNFCIVGKILFNILGINLDECFWFFFLIYLFIKCV